MRSSTAIRVSPRCPSWLSWWPAGSWILVAFLAGGCACLRPGANDPHADLDRDGIPDRRDCIVGRASEIRTSAGLEVVTLVDGRPAENCPDTRRHRIAVATVRAGAAPQPIAEFNHDHRSCPLVLRELTIERSGDLFSDGFLMVNGLSARRQKVVELKVPLTPQSRPSATPALCLRDLGAEITPGCNGRGENLLRCDPAAGRHLAPPYCVLEAGGEGATVAYLSGGSDDLGDGKSLSDACDIVSGSCIDDPLACSRDSDDDGVVDCFDCKPNDRDVAPGKVEIPCSGKNEDCSACTAEELGHCDAAHRDCLAGQGLPGSEDGEEDPLRPPVSPRAHCDLQHALCRLTCGDPPHSCDDGNECTERDRCQNGPCQGTGRAGAACTPHAVPECKLADVGSGVCQGNQGKECMAMNAPDGSACLTPKQLNHPCVDLRKWSCQQGECVYAVRTSGSCDDGNSQTVNDQCGVAGTCAGNPVGGACNDGKACTTNETWQASGQCVGSPSGACSTTPAGCPAGFVASGQNGCGAGGLAVCITNPGEDYCNACGGLDGRCGRCVGDSCDSDFPCAPGLTCRIDGKEENPKWCGKPEVSCCHPEGAAPACWRPRS